MILPIETEYGGHRFRSRLEARWAVFFDALGIDFAYETEGTLLPSGKKYLPDFKVRCHRIVGDDLYGIEPFDLWIEVKGEMSERDSEKILEFMWPTHFERDFENVLGQRDIRWYESWRTNLNDREKEKMDETLEFLHKLDKENHNSIMVVSQIPKFGKGFDPVEMGAYEPMGSLFPFTLQLVEGENTVCMPCADKEGNFYLLTPYAREDRINEDDCLRTLIAYELARRARFEYGENRKVEKIELEKEK